MPAAAKKPPAPKRNQPKPKAPTVEAPDPEVVAALRKEEDRTSDWVRILVTSGLEPDPKPISLAMKEMADKGLSPQVTCVQKVPGMHEPQWITVVTHVVRG